MGEHSTRNTIHIKINMDEAHDQNNADHIELFVKSQSDEAITFRVKFSTKMVKIRNAYAKKKGLESNAFRLVFDGNRISDDDTPESLAMEEGDTIDVLMEQTGGGALLL